MEDMKSERDLGDMLMAGVEKNKTGFGDGDKYISRNSKFEINKSDKEEIDKKEVLVNVNENNGLDNLNKIDQVTKKSSVNIKAFNSSEIFKKKPNQKSNKSLKQTKTSTVSFKIKAPQQKELNEKSRSDDSNPFVSNVNMKKDVKRIQENNDNIEYEKKSDNNKLSRNVIVHESDGSDLVDKDTLKNNKSCVMSTKENENVEDNTEDKDMRIGLSPKQFQHNT